MLPNRSVMRYKILVFVAALLAADAALSEDPGVATIKELNEYAAIIGAWEMNRKCRKLNEQLASDFRLSIAAIQKDFKQRQIPTDKLRTLTKDSTAVAHVEPYASCGKEAERAIVISYKLAWERAAEIVERGQAKKSSQPAADAPAD